MERVYGTEGAAEKELPKTFFSKLRGCWNGSGQWTSQERQRRYAPSSALL